MKCGDVLPFIRVVVYEFQNWTNCDFIILLVSNSVTAIYPYLMPAQFSSGTLEFRQWRHLSHVNCSIFLDSLHYYFGFIQLGYMLCTYFTNVLFILLCSSTRGENDYFLAKIKKSYLNTMSRREQNALCKCISLCFSGSQMCASVPMLIHALTV